MKKVSKTQLGWQTICLAVVALMLMTMMFMSKGFELIGHAESVGKITATTANIRKEANPNSEVVGSTSNGKEVSIKSQTTGTDGKIWYQVYVDANTMGYIRSDLLKITDGSTPATDNSSQTSTDAGSTETPATPSASVDVTAVAPVEGKVKGSDSVRVRSDATTNGNNIVTTAARGQKITITGTAKDSDGKDWYQVTFEADGKNVVGFIRSDYVKVSGELVSPDAEGAGDGESEPAEEPEPEPEPEPKKPYETALVNGNWYLYDYDNEKQYNIVDFISANEQYSALYQDEKGKVKSQKVAIVIMALLMIVMAVAIGLLIFKMKDAADSVYFRQVEQETIRRRTAERPQRAPYTKPGQHSAGAEKEGRNSQNAPRPAGNQPQQGKRPAGNPQQRVSGAQQTSVRRPASQGTPQGTAQQGAKRPAGNGQRPVNPQMRGEGQPVRRTVSPEQRPVANKPQEGKRPTNPQGQNPAWKSKNFMQDDDEFEFAFLNNWEDEE